MGVVFSKVCGGDDRMFPSSSALFSFYLYFNRILETTDNKNTYKKQHVEDEKDAADKKNESAAKSEVEEEMKQNALPLPGQFLIDQTFDIDKDLEALKEKYGDKYRPLLKREMLKTENLNVSGKGSIKIQQFNMLADGLCTAYIQKQTEKTFLNVDKECLQWTYRSLRLIEEILRFDCDIVGIEECDQLPFLMKYLESKGYVSFFQEKTGSPIRHIPKEIEEERKLESDSIKMPNDGVAFIFKQDKFETVNEADIQYIDMQKNKEKVLGLAVPLKVKSIDEEILFIVTHLKSTKSEEGEQKRKRQINLLLNELIKNEKNLPIVFCCDLNANPTKNKKGYDPLCYNSIVDVDGLNYESVFKMANGKEPEYTTAKEREEGIIRHVIDYIFVKNGNWSVTALSEIPKDAVIPNWDYPSDHFSIAAELRWKSE